MKSDRGQAGPGGLARRRASSARASPPAREARTGEPETRGGERRAARRENTPPHGS